jgi:hypothetical protein
VADNNPTTDKPDFVCAARRHMSGSVFKTYDALCAIAFSKATKNKHVVGTPWVCFATVKPTICNYTNTGRSQILEHIRRLLRHGRLIDPTPGKRKRWANSGKLALWNTSSCHMRNMRRMASAHDVGLLIHIRRARRRAKFVAKNYGPSKKL